MTDREILAELKKSYNYLSDIRENGCMDHNEGQLSNLYSKELDSIIDKIDDIYINFYDILDLDSIKIPEDRIDLDDGERYCCISRDISGDYEIVLDDGDSSYCSCLDVDYTWYDDKDFLNEKDLIREMEL